MGMMHSEQKIEMLEGELDELTAELIARQNELVALLNLANSTRTLFDVPSTLRAALETMMGIVAAERGFAILKRKDEEWVVGHPPTEEFSTTEAQRSRSRDAKSCVFTTAEARREQRGERFFGIQGRYGTADWMEDGMIGAPLVVDGVVCGVIGLADCRDGAFTFPHRKLVMGIGTQLSAQLDNIFLHDAIIAQTRMQAELDLAREVQLRLLPTKAADVAHLELFAETRPARAVGGDFYDYFAADGVFQFAVGDVSGKGMAAAMVMSMTKTLWSQMGRINRDQSMAWLMHTLNEAVYDDFTETRMLATLFSGRFDTETRMVQFANAGHSPVIYMPANGEPEMLEADGTALGVLTTCFCEDQQVQLGENDLLIVASDGFPEEENEAGEMFGYERMLAFVKEVAGGTAAEIGRGLFDALNQFSSPDMQFDDQTLIVLKGVTE